MILQFKRANKADVMKAFAVIHGKLKPAETLFDKVQSGLADIRLAMKGGPDALRQLQSKQGESVIARRNRAMAFENPNILRLVVDTQADLAYGNPPERSVAFKDDPKSEASRALSRRFIDVYEEERVATAFRLRTAPWALRDNSAVVKVWFDKSNPDDETGEIRISSFPKEFVPIIHDPGDADRNLGAIELQKLGGGKWARYLWTTEETGWIDESWNWTAGPNGEEPWQKNPTPGITQYIAFGFDHPSEDCGSAMWDIYLSQLQQVQLRSQVATGVRAQLLSIPYIAGDTKMRKQRDAATGQEYVYLGHDKPLLLEKEGAAGFMTPGFKLSEASDYEMARFRHYLEVHGVSATAVDSSGHSSDKPMALAIKLYRSMRERSKHITAFRDAELALANSILALAAYHDVWPEVGLHNVDDVDVTIQFPDNILPTDKMLERQQEISEVEKNVRTRKRWLKTWVMPDASDAEIEQEEQELDRQAQEMATRTSTAVAGAMGPRAGATMGPVTGGNGQSAADALLANINQGRDAMGGGAGMNGSSGPMASMGGMKAGMVSSCTPPQFAIGDYVRATVDHGMGMGVKGAIAEVHAGAPPYYAVLLDGTGKPHKWFAENELELIEAGSMRSAQ